MSKSEIGSITWRDLTVKNAAEVANFYQSVIGWKIAPVSMGEYDDYAMAKPDSEVGVAGVCHAKGPNSGLPPQWLMYVKVDDLQVSLKSVVALGGEVLTEVKKLSETSHYAVIQDPSGAVCAIYDEQD